MRALLAVLVAANPLAVALALPDRMRRDVMAVAVAGAALVAVAVAAVSAPLLDSLDVTPATFEVATAVVLGVAGVLWLALDPWTVPDDVGAGAWRHVVVPLLVPVLVTPPLVAVSTSIGADHGVAVVALGTAAAMAGAWVLTTARPVPVIWPAASRFVGLAAVVVALAMAVEGVRSV